MRNEHLTLKSVIPEEIRLECYKEALDIIEQKKDVCGLDFDTSLCLLLPCILWNLDDYRDSSPLGENWSFIHTQTAFKELVEHGLFNDLFMGFVVHNDDVEETRITILKDSIKKLETIKDK